MSLTSKIEKEEAAVAVVTYPCLREGINTGSIYLFTSNSGGIVLVAKRACHCSTGYITTISLRETKVFTGSITLQQE